MKIRKSAKAISIQYSGNKKAVFKDFLFSSAIGMSYRHFHGIGACQAVTCQLHFTIPASQIYEFTLRCGSRFTHLTRVYCGSEHIHMVFKYMVFYKIDYQ